jgi:hypothetical protein
MIDDAHLPPALAGRAAGYPALGFSATVLSSLVLLKYLKNIPLSVSSKLPPPRPRKSRPLCRKRR